jgi:D,D-heptose 1,7-bisphosphate phosphatase
MREKILVVRFGSLGDVILTSAAILNLRLNFPDSEIVYLTKERFEVTAGLIPGIDRIVSLPEKAGFAQYLRLLFGLDREQFTILIDLHGNFRSWLAGKLITVGRTSVYPKRRLERIKIVKTHQFPESWPHTIDLYNAAVQALGCQVYSRRPIVQIQSRAEAGSMPPSGTPKKVVIAPGAAHPNKQWPVERFAEVAVRLHRTVEAHVIWAVTASDANQPSPEMELGADSFERLVDCPVERLMSVLAESDLVIANDSGIMHLATATGTPVLAIFGPTHQSLGFSPRGLWDRVLEVDEPCRPCSLHGKKPCNREERFCFTRISSKDVAEAAEQMLRSKANTERALFLDRDGTIVVDKHYQSDPAQIELIAGAVDALKLANNHGFKIVILSNQSGVARGLFSVEAAERMNTGVTEMLREAGVIIDASYFCPHYPGGKVPEFAASCDCRKPASGMAERAARELGINFRRSIVIGDKPDDLNLGWVIGSRSWLVRTGHGRETESRLQQYEQYGAYRVFDDLYAAVRQAVDEGL